ncbi:DUF4283 domain protein, partial [Trifolium medium]|nr:DUF4283 domain protein [Trifolium medium]
MNLLLIPGVRLEHGGSKGTPSKMPRSIRANSCPPGEPSWSETEEGGQQDPKRRKASGLLRHSLYSLKKVVRLPSKDRSEVLKVLKKKVRQRRGGKSVSRSSNVSLQASSEESTSSGSINNDWKHWVVMQGNDQMVVGDIW